ncbi:MAG: adenosylmethionine--8-amino-7-oxononanoate transaminase [Planctomycetota bacterium]
MTSATDPAAATAAVRELDRRCVWHPFTQMREWAAEPQLVIAAGEGHYLIDTEGNRYLDGVSSLWCNLFGHRRPEIDTAVCDQLGRIAHSTQLGCASVPAVELAAKLVAAAPKGLTRVFYSDSGSEAVEIALKMTYQYCRQNGQGGRTRIIAVTEAYHGDTLGAVSVGGIDRFHATFKDLLFEAVRIHTPHCYRCPFGRRRGECGRECFHHADAVFREWGGRACALVTEPGIQGAAGMLMFPDGFLAHLRELCTGQGVFMIADEVATGFGRTGLMWGCDHDKVTPDLMCVAKGLTGGYLPVAATLATEAVFNGFLGDYAEYRTFFHGHTFTGNQLGCAAGLATLGIFEKDDIPAMVRRAGAELAAALEPLRSHPHCGEIRLKGLMGGIELVRDHATGEPFAPALQTGARVCRVARSHGVLLRPLGDVIVLMPPLTITTEEIHQLVDAIHTSIDAVVRKAS